MTFLDQLLANRILQSAVVGWMSAQILKTLLHWAIHKKFDIHRLFGDGGMPSAHSAAVTALAVATGLQEGLHSASFAVAMMLAMVVVHDACGVRQQAGKQAIVLNDILELLDKLGHTNDIDRLNEFVGHTGLQVFFGCLLGMVVAVLMTGVLF